MNTITFPVRSVFCIGDIHGNFDCILESVRSHDLRDCVMLFCGDVGFGFQSQNQLEEILETLEEECSARRVYLVFIRGNHDDPTYFDDKAVNYSHVKAVSDYTVIMADDKNILCVGGAVSVDRTYRIHSMATQAVNYATEYGVSEDLAMRRIQPCYWGGEKPVYNEKRLNDITASGIRITNVATHTCPEFCEPITKKGVQLWLDQDWALSDDLKAERKALSDLFYKLINDNHPIKSWFYGHYHYHHFDYLKNIDFYLLDLERGGQMDMVEMR